MRALAAISGCILSVIVLVDAFQTMVLARRAHRLFRITRAFYQLTWRPFANVARRIRSGRWRENYLSAYGPLSLLTLLGLWAATLILAFDLLQWSVGVHLKGFRSDLAITSISVQPRSLP
jgi:hypothetical protein